MGDRIIVKQIKLIYGHLYQIDLYNESKTGAGQRIDLCEECYNEFVNFMETIH